MSENIEKNEALDNEKEQVASEETKQKCKKSCKKDKKDDEIQKLTDEIAKQKDAYLRLAAEYENYRKRTQNEKLSIYDDATAKAVSEIIPIADSIQMAHANLVDAPAEFVKGLELIENQLAKSFEKLKAEAFGDIGDDFDPELHNAISKIESDELEANKLSMIFQKGYKIGDKIVRYAMVQVANCD